MILKSPLIITSGFTFELEYLCFTNKGWFITFLIITTVCNVSNTRNIPIKCNYIEISRKTVYNFYIFLSALEYFLFLIDTLHVNFESTN